MWRFSPRRSQSRLRLPAAAAELPRPDGAPDAGALLPAVWLGLVLGVSFLATPAKFLAPTLDLAAALDVGRLTFRVLGAVEGVLVAGALALWLAGRLRPRAGWMLAFLSALLTVEYAWLLPALDHRVAAMAAGLHPPPSLHHWIYVLCEVAKAATLLMWARLPGARQVRTSEVW